MSAPWQARLPDLAERLDRCLQQWRLVPEPPFPGLSYNYTVPVRLPDGTPAVLKISMPGESATEAEALRLCDGEGAVRLLAVAEGALLLERALPGRALPHRHGCEAVAAAVMRRLWRPVPEGHPFPSVAEWGTRAFANHRARFGGPGPMPPELFQAAEETLAERPAAPCLLHGDLHHSNILSGTRSSWLAIDPKGVVGEAAFDTYAFLHNPVGVEIAPAEQRRRADALGEALGMERAWLRRWAVAGMVLSALWSLEGGEPGWTHAIACAQPLFDD
ncbi:MAG TPA: aminoglycoside phosphotransferase family protein [Bacillota bacterium]|nr:aminoglycoside phosphotransferase family protein [Bacillota bacterium]